mgnify:CR=1 FL=1
MEPANTLRLSLFLNYSVFIYEILSGVEDARVMAKKCFDDALYDLERLGDEEIMEAVPYMQALRDNFLLWQSEELTDKQKTEMMEHDEKKRLVEIREKANRQDEGVFSSDDETDSLIDPNLNE